MAITYPDFGRSMGNALATAGVYNQMRERKELRNFLAANGEALMAGDPAALAAYAGHDIGGAMGLRNMLAARDRAEEAHGWAGKRFEMAENAENRAQSRYDFEMKQAVKAMDAAELAREAEEVRRNTAIVAGAQSPAEWDAAAQRTGATELVGRYGDKDEILRGLMTTEQIIAAELEKKQGAQFKQVTGDDARALGLDPSKAYNVDTSTGKISSIGGGDTNVNVQMPGADQRPMADKPPKGYQRRYDEARGTWVDEPIPGSEVATVEEKADEASQMAQAAYQRKYDLVDSKLSEAITMLKDKGRWVAGYGSKLSALPESSARDFQSILNTIKANLGFEELQAMRDASPTGGALGQVSEREIAFLQAMQGNLDAAQSPEQLEKVLTQIKEGRSKFASERKKILNGGSDYSPESIMKMTEQDIVNVPIEEMDPEQLDALEARWQQIKAAK